jgi:RNase H-fold protein (predicted Holliday junction resolvase)
MNYEDVEFLSELYAKINELEEFVRERGYQDRVMSAIVVGLMEEIENPEDESVEMKSLFAYNLDSRDELEIIIDIMQNTFEEDSDSLGDMLNDLGISLN